MATHVLRYRALTLLEQTEILSRNAVCEVKTETVNSLESTQDPNFLPASYLDERTLTYEPIVNFMKSTVV